MTAQWSSRETRKAGHPLLAGGASTNNVAAENVLALSGESSHPEFVVIGADRTAFFQVRATDFHSNRQTSRNPPIGIAAGRSLLCTGIYSSRSAVNMRSHFLFHKLL